jgi:hypothetical protein
LPSLSSRSWNAWTPAFGPAGAAHSGGDPGIVVLVGIDPAAQSPRDQDLPA